MLANGLLCLSVFGAVLALEKVRGVPPSRLFLYQSDDGNFKCLDGSKTIPYKRLNDDYCDCPDGSDEPGTSACPGTTFFCQNAGHIPVYLPSNRVNDGACEESCCDGSDEWLGLVKCPNTCRQKAKEHAKLEMEKESVRASGWKVKEEWQKTALILRSEIVDDMERTQAQLDAFRINLQDKETSLTKLEHESQSSSKGQEDLDALVSRYREAIRALQDQVHEQRQRILNHETILKDLAEGYNPNFQDMSVKGAVMAYQELAPLPEASMSEATVRAVLDATLALPTVECPSLTQGQSLLVSLWQRLRNKLVDFGIVQRGLIGTSTAAGDTKQIVNAKASIENIREDVTRSELHLSELQASLEGNYGVGDVYRAVKGQCFSSLISDYTYEVCLLDTLHQRSPSMSTLVGNFDHVDENGSLHYTHGQKCWNGPERTGKVDVECGAQNELLSVREAQKCEYVFRIRSPLACGPPSAANSFERKDEL